MAIELLIALASLVCAIACFAAGYATRSLVQQRQPQLGELEDEHLLPLVSTPTPQLEPVPVQAPEPQPALASLEPQTPLELEPRSVMLVPERAPAPAPSLRVAPAPADNPAANSAGTPTHALADESIPTPKSSPALTLTSDDQLEATEPMASRAAASLPVLLERLKEESQSESAALFDDQGLVVGSIGPHAGASAGVWASLMARAVADAQKCGIFDGDNQVVELRDAKLGRVRCKSVRWHHRRLLLSTVGARAAWSTASERAVMDAVGRLFPVALVMGGELAPLASGPTSAAGALAP